MTNLPVLKPKKLISILERTGWKIIRQKGSHVQLKHPNKTGFRVTIPFHNEDIAPGTLNSIIKQMGLNKKEFEKLMK